MNPRVTSAAGPSRRWRLGGLWALVCAPAITAGCSSQTVYASGQAWQQNQCNKIIDMQERERCLAPTRESYDDYQRKTDALKKVDPAE